MTWDSGYSEDISSFSKKDIDPLSLFHDHALEIDPSLDISVLSDDELLDVLKATKNPRWIQPWMGTTLSVRPISLHEASEQAFKDESQAESPISQHSSGSFSQSSSSSSSPAKGRILSLDSVPFSGGNNHPSFHNYDSSGEGGNSYRNSYRNNSRDFVRGPVAVAGESMPSSFATTNSTAFSRADDQDSLTTMCSSHDGGSSIFSTSHGAGSGATSGGCRCAFHAKASAAGAQQRDVQESHPQYTQYTQPTQYTQSTQPSQFPPHHLSEKAA